MPPVTTGPPTRPCLLKRSSLSYLVHWGTLKIQHMVHVSRGLGLGWGDAYRLGCVWEGQLQSDFLLGFNVVLTRGPTSTHVLCAQHPTNHPTASLPSLWVHCSSRYLGPSCLRENFQELSSILSPTLLHLQPASPQSSASQRLLDQRLLPHHPHHHCHCHHLFPLDSSHPAGLLTSPQPFFNHSSTNTGQEEVQAPRRVVKDFWLERWLCPSFNTLSLHVLLSDSKQPTVPSASYVTPSWTLFPPSPHALTLPSASRSRIFFLSSLGCPGSLLYSHTPPHVHVRLCLSLY